MQPILKASLIALFIFSFAAGVTAQDKDDIIVQAPGSFSLHGHIYHKHLRDAVPPAAGYVTDWEKLFSTAQEAHLDSLLAAFETKTSIQVAVVTIDSSMSTEAGFDSVTLKIANAWGVGQKQKDNGLVIGISNGLHVMRIQTGNGLMQQLPDSETQKIVNEDFLPSFEEGHYYKGTLAGLQALIAKLGGN
jgi:uncharacterized protein